MNRHTYVLTMGIVVLCSVTGPARAQQLSLKRELPALAWEGCASFAVPDAEVGVVQRQQAERLAAAATQASILGDNAAALDQLLQAATLDPVSADVRYQLARTLETLERSDDAVVEYCRYLALPAAVDSIEVRSRIDALTDTNEFAVPAAALQAYQEGLTRYDEGRLGDAEDAFDRASNAVPSWSAAVYNRGAVRLALGQHIPAARDLRRYLEMSPGAADFEDVLDLLGTIRDEGRYNPGGALIAGLLVPGLGHITTGRPALGVLFLGSAAGAVTAGFMMQKSEIFCLAPPVDGACPDGQIARENVERPYLMIAAGAAAAIAIGSAIDAFRGARRHNAEADELFRVGATDGTGGAALVAPSIEFGSTGARLSLLRLRF